MAASFKAESVNYSSRKRDSSSSTNSQSFVYSISLDLAEAAYILAGFAPAYPLTGKESALAAKVQAKYGIKGNDTNMASQSLRGPDRLLGYAPSVDMEAPIRVIDKSLEKRATSGSNYWMANIEQRGASICPRRIQDQSACSIILFSARKLTREINVCRFGGISRTMAPRVSKPRPC